MDESAYMYKHLRIFRGDVVMVLVFKVVDTAGPSEREEWSFL